MPYDQNEAVQRVADAVVKETQDHLTSLSKTTVVRLTDKNGEHDVNFAKAYADTCELASIRAASGVTSYDTEIRDALKSMSKEGVRVRYASGLTRRLDSAVRMNILDGLRAINQQVQNEVGRQFGADGYEISVHMASAPDHEDLQGRQYSLKEYADLNSRLKRPIGHLNCHHFAFAIILGVSVPNYSNQELAKIKADNRKGFTYEGKHYTMYEGSQLQRKLETAVRYAKEEQLTAAAYGDAAWAAEAQDKIRVLKEKYIAVSNASGLPVKSERMGISGYRWNKGVKKAVDNSGGSGIMGLETSNGIRVLGMSQHQQERAEERGVTVDSIKDALQNPLFIRDVSTDENGRKSQRFIGEKATVNLNPDTGTVITCWKTGSSHVKKYKGGKK